MTHDANSLFTLFLGLALGCVGDSDDKSGSELGEPELGPLIEVEPMVVDFGGVDSVVMPTVDAVVHVSNVGDAPLEITGLFVEEDDSPFDLSSMESWTLLPGDETSFLVTYDVTDIGVHSATAMLYSTDPSASELALSLLGEGLGPELVVSPDHTDFGTPSIGVETEQTVTLRNAGGGTLWLEEMSFETTSGEMTYDRQIDLHGTLPWRMAPGEVRDILVRYKPRDTTVDSASVIATSNEVADNAEIATFVGNGQ